MIRLLLAAMTLLLPLAAADFWQEKKFADWSEKQVKRMLEDSPWARPVAVRAEAPGQRGSRKGDMTDATSASKRSRGGSTAAPPEAPPATMVVVRWHSALPVRQAVARAQGRAEVPAAAEERYVVGVVNIPAHVFRGGGEGLKDKIQIRLKNKPTLMPEDIRLDRAGRGPVSVYCFFAKGRNGSPVIELDDGEVEFIMQLEGTKISRKFRLKDMLFEGKLEI